MMFIAAYETVDGNGEVEKEFNTLGAATAHIDSMVGLLQWSTISDANGEIDPTHYCTRHNITTGEGDICYKCEEEFDHARMLINLELSKHQYSLWFLCSMKVLFKCPVGSFDDAKLLYHSLITNSVTGVRIARYDETEGCESVLYKFS